ncbi:hypothetical protein, variant [Verruconis gallopava]|uniref:Uncharacterized protein n=1 Tax=Verruconis gallopava TaxID=253628 RepID=A0A0D2AV78_9PEZI|nr:uncharacterized protein PV09_05675 [Verruconis gallopava]XP_016212888.1 hypothetical protein, variant [Verruconis gallopava]KIW03018.1 hypothetical protein PV09_05675 [Verruconis gallopava]KIW03019.1 hypothetical protein, variant [Verruconis gallopava]
MVGVQLRPEPCDQHSIISLMTHRSQELQTSSTSRSVLVRQRKREGGWLCSSGFYWRGRTTLWADRRHVSWTWAKMGFLRKCGTSRISGAPLGGPDRDKDAGVLV